MTPGSFALLLTANRPLPRRPSDYLLEPPRPSPKPQVGFWPLVLWAIAVLLLAAA